VKKKRKTAPRRERIGESRHSRRCRICESPDREAIERDVIAWQRPSAICERYGIKSRTTLHLHVRALRLDERRDANIRGALSRFVERAATVKPTAAAFVQACAILCKLDVAGKLVDTVQFGRASNPLFERMSRMELLTFAESGMLPSWVTEEERKTLC
jgi:hypothetical protein